MGGSPSWIFAFWWSPSTFKFRHESTQRCIEALRKLIQCGVFAARFDLADKYRELNRYANAAKHRHAKKDVWELEWLDLTLEQRAVSNGSNIAYAV